MHQFIGLLKEAYSSWSRHNAAKMAAALAYYTVFSLAPLVVLVLALTSLVFRHEAARDEVIGQFQTFMGSQGAAVVESILKNSSSAKSGLIATITGFVVLLFGASGVFAELQDSLNQIWEVPTNREKPWRYLIREKILSVAMVVVTGFLLLVSFLLTAFFSAAGKYMSGLLPVPPVVCEAGNILVSMFVITGLFGAIYRLPEVRIAWRDVWAGAAFTAFLFVLGKSLLGLYVGRAGVASSYGAAGTLIVVLLWVFYSAQILFFGAEFTRVFAQRKGTHQKPVQAPRREHLCSSQQDAPLRESISAR